MRPRKGSAAARGPVLGTGIDLVENSRMKSAIGEWDSSFKDKVFLPTEQEYCETRPEPWRHYAGRFAVKEAVSKAFGTGVGARIGWMDIEVVRDARTGAPSVRLAGRAGRLARERGVRHVLVSLSHTRHYAVAQAVLVGPGRKRRSRPARKKRIQP